MQDKGPNDLEAIINKLEKENPELYKQLGQVSTTIGGADPSKNLEEKEEKED